MRIILGLFFIAMFAGCVSTDDATIPEIETMSVLPTWAEGVKEIHDALEAGQTVTLDAETDYLAVPDPRYAAATQFELALEPSTLVTNETWAEIDGAPAEMPFVQTYAGHVVGAPDQVARLTLTRDWVAGTVRVDDQPYRLRMHMDGNFPAGYPNEAPEGAARAAPGLHFDKGGVEPHDCLSLAPADHQPVTPVTPVDELVAKIILDGDAAYIARLDDHAFPMMVAFLNEVDGIYSHQTNIRFEIVGLHLHTGENAMSDPSDEAPLGDLAAYWNAREIERDMVHLYTGFDSSYAQANCIGGAGMPELAYTFTTIQWAESSYGFLRHTQTYAHELGHIFNAHHHYGNAAEGGQSVTIMHQGGQKVNPAFSTLSKDVIRGWAEAHVA